MLYKLWSGFTKNLRYLFIQKGHTTVKIARIGTISATKDGVDDESLKFTFIPSNELRNLLNNTVEEQITDFNPRGSQTFGVPDWERIAMVAEV